MNDFRKTTRLGWLRIEHMLPCIEKFGFAVNVAEKNRIYHLSAIASGTEIRLKNQFVAICCYQTFAVTKSIQYPTMHLMGIPIYFTSTGNGRWGFVHKIYYFHFIHLFVALKLIKQITTSKKMSVFRSNNSDRTTCKSNILEWNMTSKGAKQCFIAELEWKKKNWLAWYHDKWLSSNLA